MAISLKTLSDTSANHETRIKKLESGGTVGGTLVKLCDYDGKLKQSMVNFTFLIFAVTYYGNPYSCICVPVSVYKIWKTVKWDERGGENADRHYGGEFKWISDTQVSTGGGRAWLGGVWGLKLYYNFSYNIIYKILSSIKFKISQIISSLKIKKEVKIMAISLNDHEDRIKALEDKSSSGSVTRSILLGRLVSGSANLSKSIRDCTLVIIYAYDTDVKTKQILHCHDAQSIELNVLYDLPGQYGDKGNNYMIYRFDSYTRISIIENRYTNGIVRVVGLKI